MSVGHYASGKPRRSYAHCLVTKSLNASLHVHDARQFLNEKSTIHSQRNSELTQCKIGGIEKNAIKVLRKSPIEFAYEYLECEVTFVYISLFYLVNNDLNLHSSAILEQC